MNGEHIFTLRAFARDTGGFRCTKAQASALANACAAVLALIEQAELALPELDASNSPETFASLAKALEPFQK